MKETRMRVLHIVNHVNMGGITRYLLTAITEMRETLEYCAIVSSGGTMSQEFRDRDVNLFELDIRTKSFLHPKVFCAVKPLLKIVRDQKIDILHVHTRIGQVLAACVSRVTGVPFVTTCHGFFTPNIGRRILPAWGDAVIAISDAVREDLVNRFHVRENQIRTIYNGVAIDTFSAQADTVDVVAARKSLGISDCAPVVGIVSRIVQDKGFQCLVDAFCIVKQSFPDSVLLIVGEGKYTDTLRDYIETRSLTDSVIFLGVQESVAAVLALMDIFVLPTLTREGFGLSVVEAMAVKRPVIVSDLGGLRTVVQDNETGLLFTPGDSQMLAEKMLYLLRNPAECSRLRLAGYARARAAFTSAQMATSIGAVYRDVIRAK